MLPSPRRRSFSEEGVGGEVTPSDSMEAIATRRCGNGYAERERFAIASRTSTPCKGDRCKVINVGWALPTLLLNQKSIQ